MIPSIANLVYELRNDLRLRILGNKEILGKSQIWVEAQPTVQSLFQKLNFGNSNQKHAKVDVKLFLSPPVLLEFYWMFQIFCSRLYLTIQ